MKKITSRIIGFVIAGSMAIASIICVFVFDTVFAKNTIDYFSFFAALFLIVDGFYKIARYKNEPYFPDQFLRHCRIIAGACIFTIHVMQYVRGI